MLGGRRIRRLGILFTVYLLVLFEFSTLCIYHLIKTTLSLKILAQSLSYYIILGSYLISESPFLHL